MVSGRVDGCVNMPLLLSKYKHLVHELGAAYIQSIYKEK